jgi:protein-S-isoprenylcysteine O-methyltransferase Ste14
VSVEGQCAAPDHPGVLIQPPLLCAVTLGLGTSLHFLFPVPLLPPLPACVSGTVLLCVSAGLAGWAERVMKAAGTNVLPYRPTTAIVVTGPYRISRNPMYVSLCLLQIGIALLLDGLVPLLFLLPLALTLHFGVIRREERYLEAKFGADYLTFKNRVRRWL